MIHRRPKGDRHVSLETYWRSTCFILDLLKTDRSQWKPIGDPRKINMPQRIPMGERHNSSEFDFGVPVSFYADYFLFGI